MNETSPHSAARDGSVPDGAGAELSQPRLLFPALKPLYDRLEPLSWLLIRCAAGLILAVHGWRKIANGPEAVAPTFAKLGYAYPLLVVYTLILVEFVGGLAIAAGVFTRFFAAAVTIEMAIIFMLYLPNGFAWLNRGYEFVLLWGLITLAIWWKGGGPYSVDRRLGREL